jgi:hypothetical protein
MVSLDRRLAYFTKRSFYFLLFIVLISCSQLNLKDENDAYIDHSLITGIPCEAPCWYGLELGKSDLEDIHETLTGLDFVDQSRISEQPNAQDGQTNSKSKSILFDCIYPTKEMCGYIETAQDGTINYMSFDIAYPLTIEMLIGKLGQPQHYSVYSGVPQFGVCDLQIYWGKYIRAEINEDSDTLCVKANEGEILLDAQVDYITYWEIDTVEKYQPWPDSIIKVKSQSLSW